MKERARKIFVFFFSAFLFCLPWQTVLILQEKYLGGLKWEYGTLRLYGVEIIWAFLLLSYFFYWWHHRPQEKITWNFSQDRLAASLFLLFVGWVFYASLWSADQAVAWQQGRWVIEGLSTFLLVLIAPVSWKKAVKLFVAGAFLPVILGLAQFVWQTAWGNTFLGLAPHHSWETGAAVVAGASGRWLRAYGSFGSPNTFSGYLVLVIATLLLGKISSLDKRLGVSDLTKYFLLIAGVIITFSRAGLLAIGLLFLTGLVYLTGLKLKREKEGLGKHLFFVFIFVAAVSLAVFPVWQIRILGNSINEVRSLTERKTGYIEAVSVHSLSPERGVGAGNYTLALAALLPGPLPNEQIQPVHNIFVLMTTELGWIGVSILAAAIIVFLGSLFSVKGGQRRHAAMILLYCLLPYVILAFFDHYFWTSYTGLMVSGVYWGLVLKRVVQLLHSSSTSLI